MSRPRPRTDCWFDHPPSRQRFDWPARCAHPRMRTTARRRPRRLVYELVLDVPYYDEDREVLIEFSRPRPVGTPRVLVNGPTASPHRYHDGSLCMWYPLDPPGQRWLHEDGLQALIDRTSIHLFQENVWRATRQWPGREVPHGFDQDPRQAA